MKNEEFLEKAKKQAETYINYSTCIAGIKWCNVKMWSKSKDALNALRKLSPSYLTAGDAEVNYIDSGFYCLDIQFPA